MPGRRLGPLQWACLRRIAEGEPPTRALTAGAGGIDVGTLYGRAKKEGWATLDFRRPEVLAKYAEAAAFAKMLHAGGDPDANEPDSGDRVETAKPRNQPAPNEDGDAPAELDADTETLDPLDLLSRGSAFVSRQIARLIARAEKKGGRLDKAEIDGLVALSRMMERWEALARDRARDNQKKSDAERADILRRINRRIVELAHEEAKRLALKIAQAG